MAVDRMRGWRRLVPTRFERPIDVSASPAYFDSYLRREPWREGGYPEEWASRADLPLVSDARVAAIVHVFYPDLLDELIGHLAAIPVPFDLLVTDASGADVTVDPARMPRLHRCAILQVANRGRDLWPLAQVVNAALLDRYDLVVKVHTKRSDWREAHYQLGGTGDSWRTDLLSALLGDVDNVRGILDAFTTTRNVGMVTADGSVLGPAFWGRNEPVTRTLLKRLEFEIRTDDLGFAAGSMYWSRGVTLRRLKDLHLSAADFEDERGQVDGTTAHALERVIGLLAREDGLRIVERSQIGVSPRQPSERIDG
jgi:lipopolysaccharide biosynthesis protein